MAKRSLAMQFDEVVQAMLVSLRPRPEEAPDRDLVPLVRVAQALRDLPREEFRAALKSDLQRRASMSEGTAAAPRPSPKEVHYLRPGLTSITPYIIVRPAAQFIEFLKSAFEGTERMRMPAPDGSIMHAEVSVGNGAIEVSDGNEEYPTAPGAIHLYVDDADATYDSALQAGATSIYAPTDDHPSGDRQGAVKDQFGNHWYIATVKGWTPGPEGLRSVQPYLHLREAHKMIPFLEAAFGAEALGVHKSPEGAVLHATIRIGNATLEIDEAHGEFQPMPCHLHVYVPDTDAVYARALESGATSIAPVADQPWGDRWGAVKDQFSNHWYIAKPGGWTPGPEGIRSVQPYLHLREAHKMVPFMEAVFGAESLGVAKSPEGTVLHGTMRIGNATLEISEAFAEFQPMPCHLHVYVPDTDAAYARAMEAGATSIEAPQDKPYGDRSAGVKDAWGNSWFIATYLGK